MSKTVHFFVLLALLLTGGGINLNAQTTVTFDATVDKGTYQQLPSSGNQEDKITKAGITITSPKGAFGDGKAYRFGKTSSKSTITSTVGNITKVVITCQTKYPATGFASGNGWATTSTTATWTGTPAATVTFAASNKSARATKIEVTYTSAEPCKTVTTLAFADPTAKTFYQGDTEGITFTNAATLTPAVEGATITYESSNTDIATVTVDGTVTVNTSKAGTATIKASYAGTTEYSSSSSEYIINVVGLYQNIAALKAAYKSGNLDGILNLKDAQVTYVDGKNKYLQDESGALNVFNVKAFSYTAGDILNGKADITYTEYKGGLPEITAFTPVGDITKTTGEAPAPTKMTVAEASKEENLCKYIIIKNVAITPGKTGYATASDGEDEVQVFESKKTFVAGQYDLVGIVSYYNKLQIAFISYNPDFTIDEDAEKNAITAGDNAIVTLARKFNATAWNTLVLPFDMNAEQVTTAFGADVKLAKYTGTKQNEDGTYTLNFTTTTAITANEPVFVYGANDDAVYEIRGVTVKTATPSTTPTGAAFAFDGTYDTATAQAADWFISSDNNFYKAAGTESIKPTRAVFRPENTATAAKGLSFSIDGETTGIAAITTDGIITDSNAPMYNLAGQRVTKAYKGVVIQNGKKFIQK